MVAEIWYHNFHGSGTLINRLNPIPVAEVPGGANSGAWEIESTYDGAANDSDKTFTVPVTREWHIWTIFVGYSSSGDPGDRQLQIVIQNAQARTIADFRPNVVQAASLLRYYNFGPSLANQLAFYDTNQIQTPIPPTLFLKGGYTIRVYDNNVVAVGADDVLITIAHGKREVG